MGWWAGPGTVSWRPSCGWRDSAGATGMMWNSVGVALEEGVPTGQSSPCSSEKRVCTIHFGPLQRSAPALKDGRCPIRVSRGSGQLSSVWKKKEKGKVWGALSWGR